MIERRPCVSQDNENDVIDDAKLVIEPDPTNLYAIVEKAHLRSEY
jgi:hypothetical protein